jgi:Fe-S-cluster containining protein
MREVETFRLPVVTDWECRREGDCCRTGDLVLTPDELGELTQARPDIAPRVQPHEDARFVRIVGTPCPYLALNGECAVYPVRPYSCRRFQCQRAPGEPFLAGGPMGCYNLSIRVANSRYVRRAYTRNQKKAQRWAATHGWPMDDAS